MKSPITKEGKKRIENNLDQLIKVEREELKQAIAEARALGDLSENAEYQYAKEKQSHVEGRIMYLQGALARCEEVDVSTIQNDKIVFGATVTLLDCKKDSHITYQLVGDEEADIKQNRISFKSPLGKALIGKEEGDSVTVKAPKGDIEYEVESLKYK